MPVYSYLFMSGPALLPSFHPELSWGKKKIKGVFCIRHCILPLDIGENKYILFIVNIK